MVIGRPPKLGSDPPSDSFGRHGLSCGREGGRRRWEGGRCPTHRLHLRYQRLGNANTIILCQCQSLLTKPSQAKVWISNKQETGQHTVCISDIKDWATLTLLFYVKVIPNQTKCLVTYQAVGGQPTVRLQVQLQVQSTLFWLGFAACQ